jgi:signal transduction histidine kinase
VRRRVLGLVFATTLLAVTMLGVLIIATIWATMATVMQDRAIAVARAAASGLEDSAERHGLAALDDSSLALFVRDDAHLSASLTDGRVLSTGPTPDGDAFASTFSENEIAVTARIPRSVLRAQVLGQSLVVVAIALLALSVSMAVAWFYTRRLTKPFEDFAEMAARISTGDARQLGRRYGVPEIDSVAEVLDVGVAGFNALLEKERRVTNEVSHQLRTPLTALSLRLEEVLAADSLDVVRVEATAALGQVERLADVIDAVASANRGLVGPIAPYDIDALVDTQLSEWSPAYRAEGRALCRVGCASVEGMGVQGMQAQVLATLVENSLVHGGGTTTVRVRESGTWAVLEVTDEGPGVPPEIEQVVFDRSVSGAQSTGLGLALARTLIAADGGRLELLSARPPVFAMFLPARRPESTADARVENPAPEAQTDVWIAASSAAETSSGNTQRR